MTVHAEKTSKKSSSVSTVATVPVAAAVPVTAPVAAAVPVSAPVPVTPPTPANSRTKLPPASANIPAPPQGFVPTNGSDYRGLLPKKTELAVLPDAVAELKRFTDFAATFGKTVPSLPVVLGTFDSAQQWSSMRAKSAEWDLYCRTQEGLAWKDARGLIATMKPAFQMATSADATIASDNPSIARLLAANSTIARRGAATRKANRQLAATALAATTRVAPIAPSSAPQPPAPASPAPVAASAPGPAVVAPAPAVNGVASGAAH
jgi:hypothetical protein